MRKRDWVEIYDHDLLQPPAAKKLKAYFPGNKQLQEIDSAYLECIQHCVYLKQRYSIQLPQYTQEQRDLAAKLRDFINNFYNLISQYQQMLPVGTANKLLVYAADLRNIANYFTDDLSLLDWALYYLPYQLTRLLANNESISYLVTAQQYTMLECLCNWHLQYRNITSYEHIIENNLLTANVPFTKLVILYDEVMSNHYMKDQARRAVLYGIITNSCRIYNEFPTARNRAHFIVALLNRTASENIYFDDFVRNIWKMLWKICTNISSEQLNVIFNGLIALPFVNLSGDLYATVLNDLLHNYCTRFGAFPEIEQHQFLGDEFTYQTRDRKNLIDHFLLQRAKSGISGKYAISIANWRLILNTYTVSTLQPVPLGAKRFVCRYIKKIINTGDIKLMIKTLQQLQRLNKAPLPAGIFNGLFRSSSKIEIYIQLLLAQYANPHSLCNNAKAYSMVDGALLLKNKHIYFATQLIQNGGLFLNKGKSEEKQGLRLPLKTPTKTKWASYVRHATLRQYITDEVIFKNFQVRLPEELIEMLCAFSNDMNLKTFDSELFHTIYNKIEENQIQRASYKAMYGVTLTNRVKKLTCIALYAAFFVDSDLSETNQHALFHKLPYLQYQQQETSAKQIVNTWNRFIHLEENIEESPPFTQYISNVLSKP